MFSPRSSGSLMSAGSPRSIISPRNEVGEIDTTSPFRSVRAAVSLFGEAGPSPKTKPNINKSKTAEERVQEKENQLHLALRELDSFKQQIRSTETTKAHALRELEKAKTTLQELTNQLETLCKSKQEAIEATQAIMARFRGLQVGVDAWKDNNVDDHLHQEQFRASTGKEAHMQSLKTAMEEAEKKIKALKEDSNPQLVYKNLVEKLEETNEAIEVLQEQLNDVRASDLDAFRNETSKLDLTKKAFQDMVAEESSIRSLVDSLQLELESLKGDHSQLALAENLQVDLGNNKKELESTIRGEIRLEGDASTELSSAIQRFIYEADQFLHEAEEMQKNAEILRQEAVTIRVVASNADERLEVALKEIEEAKAAEKITIYQIKNSSRTEDATILDSNKKIILSDEEYEALSRKPEKIRNEAIVKVATTLAQVETITANEKEILMKIEVSLKKKQDTEAAIEEALKVAQMAEAAKQVVEGELHKLQLKKL